ncbi:MAG: uracil-DNA glycosylase [bacterium]|nr:uracil-DNA glycosylase [bacterium]
MSKLSKLEELKKELEINKSLPLRKSNLVFGEGNINCKVMFIGEAPGAKEDEQKRPFVGRSGELLNNLINSIGWKREDVYITNIVKRRPPENRDPLPNEIDSYRPYLAKQIEIINPVLIVTLGRFSMNYFLPTAKISRDQGNVFKLGSRFIAPVFHPAAALRSTGNMEALKAAFKKIPRALKKCETPVQ